MHTFDSPPSDHCKPSEVLTMAKREKASVRLRRVAANPRSSSYRGLIAQTGVDFKAAPLPDLGSPVLAVRPAAQSVASVPEPYVVGMGLEHHQLIVAGNILPFRAASRAFS